MIIKACPICGSKNLDRSEDIEEDGDDMITIPLECEDCAAQISVTVQCRVCLVNAERDGE